MSEGPLAYRRVRRVNYLRWLLMLLFWDGITPAVLVLLPFFVNQFFPNRRDIMEFAAITVPIVAFFIRFYLAKRHIYANQCAPLMKGIQYFAMGIAVLVLVLIDLMLFLAQEMPNGAMFATWTDLMIWGTLFGLYFSLMGLAMFPGRTEERIPIDIRDGGFASDEVDGLTQN